MDAILSREQMRRKTQFFEKNFCEEKKVRIKEKKYIEKTLFSYGKYKTIDHCVDKCKEISKVLYSRNSYERYEIHKSL